MTDVEKCIKEVLCLQLKKPKYWNWEISTSKSSPHIALPTIQLYNSKGKLLVETNDNGTTQIQRWNSLHRDSALPSEEPRKFSQCLQRSRSSNLEKMLPNSRTRTSEQLEKPLKGISEGKNIQRCRSDSVAMRSYTKKRKIRSLRMDSTPQSYKTVELNYRASNGEIRADSYDTSIARLAKPLRYQEDIFARHRISPQMEPQELYDRRKGRIDGMDRRGEIRARTYDPSYARLANPTNYEANISSRHHATESTLHSNPREPYNLKKSHSDGLDIKVKAKLLQIPTEKQSSRPYHRRSRSDDLFQKSKQKYDLEESRRRAENDGYLKFIHPEIGPQSDGSSAQDRNKKNRLVGYLATAETVICDNKPKNIEITNVAKPKKYVLRQSRAGTLVLEKENFSAHHRRRCHGEFGDCAQDENDVYITEDSDSINKEYPARQPQRSTSYRDVLYNPVNAKKYPDRFRNDILTDLYTVSEHWPQQYRPWASSKPTRVSSKPLQTENHLFYSKSDVFPFQQLLAHRSTKKYYHPIVDENSNYIVNEPLTTPDSDHSQSLADSISISLQEDVDKKRGRSRRKYHHSLTFPNSTELDKGPIIHNQKTSNRNCDLLQLVRRLSSSKVEEDPISNRNYRIKNFKTFARDKEPKQERQNSSRRKENEGACDVSDGMGANVSRHSTKGLSGRRSQSSGSICNGKGRHQGDGSGKGSGGSLPSYLDERGSTSTNNYEDDHQNQLDDSERLPPLGDGAPLHWKFSDGQTSQLQDQGYGSERSPEEEYPPPLPDHDMEQCHHHLEAHSCYPFITPESTFTVKLTKGSRGLGLSVTGGIESGGSWPGLVRIKRLFPHQPASTCGVLNVGDLLLEANGVPLTGLTNYEALEVLRTATNQVELKVCRPPPDVLNCVSPVSEVPPPPPTRREPPNSLNLSSNNYYGNSPEDEYFNGEFEVTLTKIQGSLGFTLRKEDESALGHYVRALVREPALTDGRIKAGDRIIAVNDVEIYPMTHEQAVQYLRQCGDQVKLRLYRDTPQTPVSTLSPTEVTPRTSFSKKANLRQEAVDMLNDIAVRKLLPGHQQVAARRSLSPTSSPRRLRRQNHPSDASQESGTKYIIPEEQFHEGMLKCKNFDEESFSSLFIVDSDDMERPSRPNSLDLYNPNQTPVAARKPKFNFSLAHNAYELNNLDPELLDAPNLTYTLGTEDGNIPELDTADNYPKEPASMPHIPLDNSSIKFSHKNPAYQSAHPPCVESDGRSSSSASKSSQQTHKEETDTIKRKKGILKKDSSSSKYADKTENKTESERIGAMKEDFEILAIELNKGWNSRLGFSLQGAAGVTYVSAVYADSVAAKDGRIKPGDRILKVNDENVEHLNTSEIIDLLRIVRGPVCIVVKRIKSTEDCGKSNAEN
ncbi:uncharacterized protein [Euwallacea similis]|uniref:uncharacterized protein isoform X2 n=1 Tax=Euwallacea similis TaxID=1736056 RepID=UPI00344C0DE5